MKNNRSMISLLIILFSYFKYILCEEGVSGFTTYHLYQSSTPITSVACSDGINGLMTRWKISDLSTIFPYVAAWNKISWNSPKCGTCFELTDYNTKKRIYVIGIDQCGPENKYDSHFEISQEAFVKLFGQPGIRDGHGIVKWKSVSLDKCQKRFMNYETDSSEKKNPEDSNESEKNLTNETLQFLEEKIKTK
jgi:hypothetical protein